MTGRALITLALQEIGALGVAESLDPDEADDCLTRLNLLIDELALDRQWLHRIDRVTKTLSASTASYTIGSGGSINTTRPTWIDRDAAKLVINTAADPQTEI